MSQLQSDKQVLWKEGIKKSVSTAVFSAFIEPLKVSKVAKEGAEITLTAPSKLVGAHVEKNYFTLIKEALGEAFGRGEVTVLFDLPLPTEYSPPEPSYVVIKKSPDNSAQKAEEKKASSEDATFWVPKNAKHSFETFVPGKSNNLAFRAARGVASATLLGFSPLVIYGGVGLGKSHLLHAIAHDVAIHNPKATIGLTSAEHFTNELVKSIRDGSSDSFRARFRGLNVLLVDDLQFLGGKAKIQEEFLHTINALTERGASVVLCADRAPSKLVGFEPRLLSRLVGGLGVELEFPSKDLVKEIISSKASDLNTKIPDGVLKKLVALEAKSVREIEGALNKIITMGSLLGEPVSVELANRALKEYSEAKEEGLTLSVMDIKRATASYFSIKLTELSSKSRSKNIARSRHIAMYLCRKHTALSYPEIGSHFGGKDHSSVIYSVSLITEQLCDESGDYTHIKKAINEIEASMLKKA